ncbi:hypothetical protein Val02_41250 [Virgisporangium aliadipatigenens]|uniref:HTH cro/C1-type domain-containing protein n=1 Tax=Virgisporangium aliadipatigenens TaxID=741659 RepID=A0A8J3YKV4_9ACTN|nr:helix-turn-helix transcriptional regulator [Virgisporangium aliadipatigenens]GIJ47239.1 hypothetical protein Val02_41250 [Virgisporangium aliadipatigenens]
MFSRVLREYRIRYGFTQREVAEQLAALAWRKTNKMVAVDPQMVSKWERGTKLPSSRYRQLLCELIGVSHRQLVGAEPAPVPVIADTSVPNGDVPITVTVIIRTDDGVPQVRVSHLGVPVHGEGASS